jgi:type II secretory pathway pseudopilin PulG
MLRLTQSTIHNTTTRPGFTLLELLISVTIMMLLVGLGVASFITFNERQQLTGAAKELQEFFRSAQTRARTGDVPAGCGTFSGYNVQMAIDNPSAQLFAVCSTGDILRSEKTLSGGARPTVGINMTFINLRGGVTNASTVVLRLPSGTLTYSFKVTAGGEITQGNLNE